VAIDGAGIFYNRRDSKWYGTAEFQNNGGCPTIGGIPYIMWLIVSDDGANTFHIASPAPLTGMSTSPGSQVLYAGGRSTVKIGAHWHSWPHINYPSCIYHSQSDDLYNWKTDPVPVVIFSPTMFGLTRCNQAADTSIIEYKGNTYLFYDGTDNVNGAARIGYSKFNGTFAQYDTLRTQAPPKGAIGNSPVHE
jgi:hypothetical protein